MNINSEISKITGIERDYEHCLNAMHEAEKVLKDKGTYFGWLTVAHGVPSGEFGDITADEAFKILTSSAAQRAEAFLKCLGLWKDDACPKRPTSDYRNHLSKI